MIRRRVRYLAALAALLGCGGFAEAAPGGNRTFLIQQSEVAVPKGVPLGKYRRIIQPFKNWTLICDENLKAMRRVCNITQSIVDGQGKLVFSWSLAGTRGGIPVMIVRVPARVGIGNAVLLSTAGEKRPLRVELAGCNSKICVGFTPLNAALHSAIEKGRFAKISYRQRAARIFIRAPLKGLKAAVAAIK